MPTNHKRHAITETEDISDALALARQQWPELGDRPGALLRRLILTGREFLALNSSEANRDRRDAIAETSGALSGVFGPGYLDDLRQDWPE
ncbi:hypothetical protein [Mycolicibacterium brumae]|uniref:Uncharacterized protein n=1 Tax=Mycolicibacterium brumae TaxID=85968 RepID=A0A2G5P7J4_9MYCO|nr:hypothetical protein [Mycolicibacterium brumae]MCV7194724.1 hypothetical protein [Mycolicibacterium brumae]PIB74275.1 hypothetical protein CQY22_013460 [Mycolicibacterium brumae]RWA15174.1 hypothetical protein MBRU_11185 [Mycolicibacterium brumae DSM 44177]UWW08242.1 hypothetical protein L2Z93_001290 [Mycolicibacterium brumae]